MAVLRATDFNRSSELDMWKVLVEEAIDKGTLPQGTDPEELEELNVRVLSGG